MKAHHCKALPSTWAFQCKCFPDGSIQKLEAHLCVCVDQQTYGVDYFESNAPVVQWRTVQLLLILSLVLNWTMVQTDYTTAFAQATLHEVVYMEMPKDFSAKQDGDFVVWLNLSSYGLCQAPLSWYEHLKTNLEQCEITASNIDACLFINHQKQIFYLVYVNDVVWVAPSQTHIDTLINSLKDDFDLTIKCDIQAFLGIQITHL